MFSEKNFRDRPATTRKRIVGPELQSILYDLPRQRVSVRVQSRAWKTNQDIVGPHALRAKYAFSSTYPTMKPAKS